MKIKINHNVLLKYLSDVSGIQGKINPILKNVKVEAKNNRLSFSVTDCDIYLKEETNEVMIEEEGISTVDTIDFLNAVRKLSESVTIISDDKSMNIISGKIKFKLQHLSCDDFPIEPAKGEYAGHINIKNLRDKFKKLLFLIEKASMDPLKAIFHGVCVTGNEILGTDGSIGAGKVLYELDGLKHEILIPIKVMKELIKLDIDFDVSIYLNNKYAVLEGESVADEFEDGSEYFKFYMQFVFISGAYPINTVNNILKFDINNYKFIKVRANEFYRSVDVVSLFTTEGNKPIDININNNEIVCHFKDNINESNCSFDVIESNIDNSFNIRFNSNVLKSTLILLENKEIYVYVYNSSSKIIICSDDLLYVLMPLNIL